MRARRSRPICSAVDRTQLSPLDRGESSFGVAVILVYGMPTTNAGEL
jgi:hypothetical protein